MFSLFWKKRKSPEPLIKRLIKHASEKKIKVTFEINNQGSIYQILTYGGKKYGYEEGNAKLSYYISDVRDKLEINFDESSSFVFARVINSGDNFDYLFSDKSGKIYHVNIDNGRNPKVRVIAKNLIEMTGDFLVKEIKSTEHHFKFCQPIFRIGDFLDYDRLVEIDIHGFLIEHYEDLLKKIFEKSCILLKLERFEYEKFDWKDLGTTHYPVKLKINGVEFKIQILKSSWFDFDLPNQINPFLKELNIEQTIQILHEEDWEERHAVCLVDEEEYETLSNKRVIAVTGI